MKKILLASAVTALTVNSAFAESNRQPKGIITAIDPQYEIVYIDTPVRECVEVQVPIYGQGQATTGDTIVGAIIGGAIGNQFGSGSGKDAMTVLGAIAGADVANKNGRKQIIGYTTEQQCSVVTQTVQQQQIRNYLITYEWNGIYGQSYTTNEYYIGQKIPVNVTVIAK